MKKLTLPIIIIAFILQLILLFGGISITGGAIIGDAQTKTSAPADQIHEFFLVDDVIFPIGGCGDIAKGLYESTLKQQANEMVGFKTEGPTRAATINFVLDRIRKFGTVDMITGNLIDDPYADSLISINTEAVVRTPKETRKTFYNMDLYGIANQYFYIQHGRFATPSLDCTFFNKEGYAVCDCEVHAIRDIAVAGIPNPLRVELENVPPALR